MTIHCSSSPVDSGIGAKRTDLANLRVLFVVLVATTMGLHGGESQAAETAAPPATTPMAGPPATLGVGDLVNFSIEAEFTGPPLTTPAARSP